MSEEEKRRYWAMMYTTVVGWDLHPGRKSERLSFDEAALYADEMVKRMEERYPLGRTN